MDNKVLSVGDYILITDDSKNDYYLRIGVIKSIAYTPNGELLSYDVKLNLPCGLLGGVGMFQKTVSFGANLPYRCKVLSFKD